MILFGDLVGASGFEPEASCAQGRFSNFRKSRNFNYSIESSRLSTSDGMCTDVPGCSRLLVGSLQKSLQFSVSEKEADT